jgi:hypothetical protein
MPTPFSDFWDFLIGNTDDHNALGSWKYLFVVLFFTSISMSCRPCGRRLCPLTAAIPRAHGPAIPRPPFFFNVARERDRVHGFLIGSAGIAAAAGLPAAMMTATPEQASASIHASSRKESAP